MTARSRSPREDTHEGNLDVTYEKRKLSMTIVRYTCEELGVAAKLCAIQLLTSKQKMCFIQILNSERNKPTYLKKRQNMKLQPCLDQLYYEGRK